MPSSTYPSVRLAAEKTAWTFDRRQQSRAIPPNDVCAKPLRPGRASRGAPSLSDRRSPSSGSADQKLVPRQDLQFDPMLCTEPVDRFGYAVKPSTPAVAVVISEQNSSLTKLWPPRSKVCGHRSCAMIGVDVDEVQRLVWYPRGRVGRPRPMNFDRTAFNLLVECVLH